MNKFKDLSVGFDPSLVNMDAVAAGVLPFTSAGYDLSSGMPGVPPSSMGLGAHPMSMSTGPRGRSMDLSGSFFSPSFQTKGVAELLQALPMVLGSPVASSVSTSTTTLLVNVQYLDNASLVATTPLYDGGGTNNPPAGSTVVKTLTQLTLSRMGIYVSAPKIDERAVASTTSGNTSSNRISVAVNHLLVWLDYYLARGTGAEAPVVAFKGIVQQANDLGQLSTGSVSLAVDANWLLSKVNPRGRGAGAGPHCLIGNARMMRSLMNATAGGTGTSGWRHDPRTGLIVWHYQGIPFYRTDLDDTVANTESYLLAANLGADGLHLVHVHGSAESRGIQVDDEGVSPQQGQARYLVHGAWALLPFDVGAIIGLSDVAYTVA